MKSLSKKAKSEEKDSKKEAKKEEKRSISDEAAKKSVVSNEMQTRRMPGEGLKAWKQRTGLDKKEAEAAKKSQEKEDEALKTKQQERVAKNQAARKGLKLDEPKKSK